MFIESITTFDSIINELKKYKIKCHLIQDKDATAVSGLYDDIDDKIYITVNQYFTINEIKHELLLTVCHELIHQRQFYYREFQYPIYQRYKEPTKDYLGNPDEIEAYAHDIYLDTCFLQQKPISDNIQYQEYLSIFDANSQVIKSLIKHYYRWINKYQNLYITK